MASARASLLAWCLVTIIICGVPISYSADLVVDEAADLAADDSASHLSMTLDAALAEGEGLMKDLDELDTLVRGAEGGFQDEDKGSSSPRLRGGDGEDVSGEKAVDDGESLSLKPTAEEDSLSADLFTELSTLNAELEAMGVKAFGELEESAYRRADGSWDTATLEADITAVKDELHIQEIDAQAHEVHGEEGDSADPPKLSLRGDGAEADDRMGLREEGEAPDTAPAECPVAEEKAGNSDNQPRVQLRGDTDEAEKGIAEASGSDSEEDDEGRRLFALLKALNPMVEERIYFKKGKWRIDTLKYDIEACGGGEAEEDEGEEDTRPDNELFDELVALNAQLEAQGIKAFGELEAQSYQKKGGEWHREALLEDLAACRMEVKLQADEAAEAKAQTAQAAEKEARMKRFAEMFGKTDLSDQEEIANIAAGGAAPAAPGLKGDGDGGNEPAAGACGT